MCKYCGNTGLCYSFLMMALVYFYNKGKMFIKFCADYITRKTHRYRHTIGNVEK